MQVVAAVGRTEGTRLAGSDDDEVRYDEGSCVSIAGGEGEG